MANELSITVTAAFSKSGVTASMSKTKLITISGTDMCHQVQAIGTTPELLDKGDVSPGYLIICNLDSTNFVELSLTEAMDQKFCKLLAGQSACLPVSTGTIWADADTATCNVEFLFVDL